MAAVIIAIPVDTRTVNATPSQISGINKDLLAESISPYLQLDQYPESVRLQGTERKYNAELRYTLDDELQNTIFKLFATYHPDYAAFVAIEPDSGKILVMAGFSVEDEGLGNLALLDTYPAASVFKIITASASIDMDKLKPSSVIPFNGKSTTLYKGQVLRHKNNRWTRRPSLTNAFAQSSNPVFARIGIYEVGADNLMVYASRFGFNAPASSNILLPSGRSNFDSNSDWALAEAASGFTRDNTISPLHGALLAATIVNQGKMMEPYVVDAVLDDRGVPLYLHEAAELQQSISSQTAENMRVLMRKTITSGSARKSFKGFFRKHYRDLDVGGKTGTLTGYNPKGKTDWFVGYGDNGKKRVAFAALTVNKKYWTVKSSYVARKFLEEYYREP